MADGTIRAVVGRRIVRGFPSFRSRRISTFCCTVRLTISVVMALATRRHFFRRGRDATSSFAEVMQPRRTRRKENLQNQQRPGCKLSAMLQHALETRQRHGICDIRMMTLPCTKSLTQSQNKLHSFSPKSRIYSSPSHSRQSLFSLDTAELRPPVWYVKEP